MLRMLNVVCFCKWTGTVTQSVNTSLLWRLNRMFLTSYWTLKSACATVYQRWDWASVHKVSSSAKTYAASLRNWWRGFAFIPQDQQTARAISVCSEVLSTDPHNVNALKDRAEALLQDDQYEEGTGDTTATQSTVQGFKDMRLWKVLQLLFN